MDIKKKIKPAKKKLGITKLWDHQIGPINSIISHQDTFDLAPTSAGKSAIFEIPAISNHDFPTVVIEPTLAVMHDQVLNLKKLGISAEYLDSSMSNKEKESVIERFQNKKINILYLTPEKFTSVDFLYVLESVKLFMVVVDEAHCVLDWGYSFRDAYLQIGDTIDSLEQRPVVSAFTATASHDDINEICELLHMDEPQIFTNDLYRKNLIYIKKYASTRKEKQKLLMKYLRKYHKHSSVIYCNTRKAVDAVYEVLSKKYPDKVVECHADMSNKKRTESELEFLTGKKKIMVATTAFGMGINLGTLDLVIHFNMPLSLTDYVQQSGRAGRNDQKAHCVLLYSDEDYYTNRVILMNDVSRLPETEAEKRMINRLNEMRAFCDDTEHCMVTMMLKAFGQHREYNCNRCTNCQTQRRK